MHSITNYFNFPKKLKNVMWFTTCTIDDVENPRRKIRSFRRVENHVSYVTYVTEQTLPPSHCKDIIKLDAVPSYM